MRKAPQQQRSRDMVERIVVAGRSVLVSDGYEVFSTNRVAEVAGISPGSLYQYFPNKAAIIDVVIDRYLAEVAERVVAALGDRVGASGPSMVREVLAALLTALEADAALLRVVTHQLPLERTAHRRIGIERRVQELAVAYAAGRGMSSLSNAAGWVLVLAIENLAVRWVLDQPPIPRDELLEQIAELVTGFVPWSVG